MIRIFTIPFSHKDESFHSQELEDYIRSKRGCTYKAEFFKSGDCAYWTIFVNYEEDVSERSDLKLEKVYQQALYEELRQWRNIRAEKEGIPSYMIYTNNQIKEMIIRKCRSKESLKNIHGIGDKKCKEYGDETINILQSFLNEVSENGDD